MEKDKNKGFHEVDEQNLDTVAGGWRVGGDKHSQATYNKAGVTHQKNTWSSDQYWYNGTPISQKEAEKITDVYLLNKGLK